MTEQQKLIVLSDFLESKLRKEQELEFYQQELAKIQEKMLFLQKDLDITNIIIDMIQQEKVHGIQEHLLENKDKE